MRYPIRADRVKRADLVRAIQEMKADEAQTKSPSQANPFLNPDYSDEESYRALSIAQQTTENPELLDRLWARFEKRVAAGQVRNYRAERESGSKTPIYFPRTDPSSAPDDKKDDEKE